MTESSKPPLGRRMKTHAPPPPHAPQPAPRHIFRKTVPDGGGTSGLDAKENMLRPTVDLQLTLPQGWQTSVTEDGSKALMDLLVELCSRYHLNPALHTLELLSPEGHSLGFKPNALLGSLNVACVLIKEKVWEEKVVRRPAPKVPEKTVRLMVNYHGSQKAVVRVNPFVPLQALIPVICGKCEFDPAHVLLLKDSISRHELPLDRSLTELGIKELYVHDQSLVLQPKMASAPVLNYSDGVEVALENSKHIMPSAEKNGCIRSSTTTLDRPEKKGLLSIFQFSRRKSKTETTSMDMDDSDDKVIQNTGTQSNGLSTVSGIHNVEDRPSTLGQSQSVMNISRMSPKSESKKRRAPAPPRPLTHMMGQTSFEGPQIGLGSESQQRKRKAPAPPPTPSSVSPGSDDTSAAPTPDSHATQTPTPAFRNKASVTVSSTTVVTQTTNPVSLTTAVQPPVASHATTTASSPTPSSSTVDSLAVHDSCSELSHSFDDSDADLDQAGSHCSTLTHSSTSESEPPVEVSSSRMEESEKAAKFDQEATSASSCSSETESALNLKLDEVENNRHSAMGTTDQPAPPKPPRSPALEPPQVFQPPILSSPPLSCPPIEPTESNSPQSPMELEEAAPQSWLDSTQTSKTFGQIQETETPEEESLSPGSSSTPNKGYAVSRGVAEDDDSGVVSSPSDTQPTSPEGSLSLDGISGGTGDRLLGPVQDNSSDSDAGSAAWHSQCRNKYVSSQTKSSRFIISYEEDPLTAQLHETLADIEGLADHIEVASAKKTFYTMSTDSNEVPVSVVDIDVPVTAIDDVLGEYEHDIAENEAKSITRTESAGSKGPGVYQQPSMDSQNKNNNACTTSDSNKRCFQDSEQPSQPEQHRKSMENGATHEKKKEKMIQTKRKELSVTDTRGKEDKQRTTSAVKSYVDMQKQSESTELRPDPLKSNTNSFQEKKHDLSLTTHRSVSAETGEEMHRGFQNISGSHSTSSGKITRVTSRFGMKTFTVVPPKPSIVHASAGGPVGTLTAGAIKIDDQGNMVKVGMSWNKTDDSLKTGINCKEESVLLGKAKAFWNSNGGQEIAVPYGKGLIDKDKENADSLKSTPTVISDTALKTSNTDNIKTDRAQPEEILKEKIKEPVKDIQVAKEDAEIKSKFSPSKSFQLPSNKPALPPPPFPDLKRDLSFLKPSRRTSSQYVASAFTKCAPKTSVKLNSISNISDATASVKTHTISAQRSGHSMQSTPVISQFSLSDNKETVSASKPNPPGPKRSVNYPEYVSDVQRDFGEVGLDRNGFGSCARATKETPDVLETGTAKDMHSSGPIQINVTASNDRDDKHIRPRSPTPAQTSLLQSSAKLPTNPKTQGQTSNIKDMTPTAKPDVKPFHSVTVSDTGDAPATCGPQPATVFGPVRKFKPVICGPVAKETSLHSSLMEAIQSGRGKDRLNKISTSGPSSTKKPAYAEEQNERSALMAAIRTQSSAERLRKTKSEAGTELEKFRKAASEKEGSADPPSYSTPSSITSTSTVFIPTPPAPIFAPPPPPPVLPKGKPNTMTQPSANTPMNPALAREAMLEAIRSGSAAERLKKVTVPTKTVHVNGRLGTIQPTSSTLPRQ